MNCATDRSNKLIVLSLLGAAGMAAACSSSSRPAVKVTYSDIAAPPAAAAPKAPPIAVPASLAAPAAPEAKAPAPPSTKEVVNQALEWAQEGLRQYVRRDYDGARESLNDARILLLQTDMPEFWKSQGLAVLQAGLPADLKRYDLAGVARELEQVHLSAADQAEKAYVENEVRRILRQFGDTAPEERYLPTLVEETHHYIEFYRGKYRDFFERAYARRHKYWPGIQDVFAARKLPPELAYIAFVESGFNPRSQSHANAIGLWQFIPETGRRYGLTEREDFHDVRKSTVAAADYLLDLISIFGSPSFLLATAAYNTGEGRIVSCLRGIDNPFEKRSFWEIRPCLATETQEYVPRIMAAAVLSADPRRFGFDLPSDAELDRRYEVVSIPQVVPLPWLAETTGVELADLKAANSELDLSSGTTPGRNFPLYLPHGAGAKLAAALTTAPPEALRRVTAPEGYADAGDEERGAARRILVRRGDTLRSVARRHGVSTTTLIAQNHLRRPYRLHAGQRLVLAARGGEARAVEAGGGASSGTVVFTVRRGHSLDEIAGLFAVRGRDLMRWNHLKSTSVRAGQRLTIHPSRRYRTQTYKVKHGDKPAGVARRFGISVADLLFPNGLEEGTHLKAGQRLVFYVPA